MLMPVKPVRPQTLTLKSYLDKFKEGDAAFVGIITRVDDNDKNKIKDKSDKK